MTAQPHVVDLDGAHAVVVPDWNAFYSQLSIYCGREKHDDSLPRGADLYILCHDGDRARQVLRDLQHPYHVAQHIVIARSRIYGAIATELMAQGHAVACDTDGPDCDTERLSRLHPPPVGSDVRFEWSPRDKMHRIRSPRISKDGVVSTDSVLLRDGDDWTERLEKTYARIARRKTVPATACLSCHAHVASMLSELDEHAALMLAHWRSRVEAAGIDAHQNLDPLILPPESMTSPGELVALELSTVRGSYLISATCHYRGGTRIVEKTLMLKAEMPETMAIGLIGVDASVIWGDEHLKGVTVRAATRPANATTRNYSLDVGTAPMPTPAIRRVSEDSATEELKSGIHDDITLDGLIVHVLHRAPRSVLLHVMRTLKAIEDRKMDLKPWIAGPSEVLVLRRNGPVVSYAGAGKFLRIGDLLD